LLFPTVRAGYDETAKARSEVRSIAPQFHLLSGLELEKRRASIQDLDPPDMTEPDPRGDAPRPILVSPRHANAPNAPATLGPTVAIIGSYPLILST